ncbi:hypothetical protein KKH27_10555, partial [bacterium]|nr:hypothetical protein [bacterium]
MNRRILVTGVLAVMAAFSVGHADWNFLPAGRPIIGSISADSSGQRLYATIFGGGVWFTDNGGLTWEPVSERFWPGWIKYAWVTVAAPAGDTLIATVATAPGSSYDRYNEYNGYSYDGGQSFQPFAEERVRDRGSVQVWHAHRNVWFHLDGNLLSRSTDFGQTWGVPDTLPAWSDARLIQSAMSDNVLYAAEGDNYSYYPPGRLWRSEDLGTTWTCLLDFAGELGEDTPQIADFVPLSNGDLLVLVNGYRSYIDTTLLVSTDSGESWEPIVGSGLRFHFVGEAFECRRRPGRVFVNSDLSVALSDDYGRTWSNLGGVFESCPYPQATQEPFWGNIFANCYDGRHFQSADGGETWDTLSAPPIGYSYDGAFVMNDEAVFFMESSSLRWQLEPPFAEWHEIARIERPDTLVDLTPAICKWADTLTCLASLYVPEQGSDGHYSCMAYSLDNGESWTLGPILPFRVEPLLYQAYDILFHDSQARIIVPLLNTNNNSISDSIAISEDWGRTWDLVRVPGTGVVWDIEQTCDAIFALRGFVFGGGENVLRSTDGGATWHELTGLQGSSYEVYMAVCGDEVFLPNYADNRLWHWDGQSWSARGSLPFGATYVYYPFEMIAISGDPPILMGVQYDSAAVWFSRDRGDTWTLAEYQLPYERQISRMSSLTHDPYRNRVWLNTGVGACWLDVAELVVPDRPLQFKPADYTILSVYPNPFNDQARVRFDLLKSERVEITLYDLTGRRVR